MAVALRPYQEAALSAVMATLKQAPLALLQAATGAGKTIMFSELIRRWLTAYPGLRICILAHRQELITQARDKLVKVWPEGRRHIGLACASLGEVDVGRPIIIGSVQTLARRELRRPVNLLIVDEAHRVPPQNVDSQYGRVIARLRAAYPSLRVLGVTATPFRLGHGYIYGDQCRKMNRNFFPRLDYRIGLNTLIDKGFLVPIRAKEAVDMSRDLAAVALSGGDYNLGALGSLMGKTVHLESAVRALADHGEGRGHALVFAVSIDHAERLTKLFQAAGHRAAYVHSEMPNRDRTATLKRFDRGEIDVLVNVGILTEGWDNPAVDLILLCRPTKSPALFVQMVGRGARLAPGKENLLVLDLANNFREHGDPDSPFVTWQGGASAGEPRVKFCGRCGAVTAPVKRVCPECGWVFPVPESDESNDLVNLREINFRGPPGTCRLEGWRAQKYRSARGNTMVRLDLNCRPGGLVHHFLDIEGANPYTHYKTQYWWWNMSGGQTPPKTADEALSRLAELQLPEKIVLLKTKDKKYQKVRGW